jgi:hypothetical protein
MKYLASGGRTPPIIYLFYSHRIGSTLDKPVPNLKSQSVRPARSLPLLTELLPLTNSPGQPDINCTCRSNAQRPAHCDQQRIQSASIRTVRHCIALSALCPNPLYLSNGKLYTNIFSLMHATCPAHLLYITAPTICGPQCKSSKCS